jgi:hypothetical protein
MDRHKDLKIIEREDYAHNPLNPSLSVPAQATGHAETANLAIALPSRNYCRNLSR